jgi:hypothetical protein
LCFAGKSLMSTGQIEICGVPFDTEKVRAKSSCSMELDGRSQAFRSLPNIPSGSVLFLFIILFIHVAHYS